MAICQRQRTCLVQILFRENRLKLKLGTLSKIFGVIDRVALVRCDILWDRSQYAKKRAGGIGVPYQSYDETMESGRARVEEGKRAEVLPQQQLTHSPARFSPGLSCPSSRESGPPELAPPPPC